MRQEDIMEILSTRGPMTTRDIMMTAYPDVEPWRQSIIRNNVAKGIRTLQKWGAVEAVGIEHGKYNDARIWAVVR